MDTDAEESLLIRVHLCLSAVRCYFDDFTATKSATLGRSRMLCAVVLIVAAAPRSRLGCSLFGRFVQICPPRRLGSSLKFAARVSSGLRTVLSCMNSRSSVLRAAPRLMFLLTVTRTVWPGLRSVAMVASPGEKSSGGV